MPKAALLPLLASLVLAAPAAAQQDEPPLEENRDGYVRMFTVHKQFLIAGTFRSLRAATALAVRVAEQTELEYRPQTTVAERGSPTFAREVCERNGWDYPCYVPRGRWDDGAYFSVEPTDRYRGMQPGYFVVVAASGSAQEIAEARNALASRCLPSFVKTIPIWTGCIHWVRPRKPGVRCRPLGSGVGSARWSNVCLPCCWRPWHCWQSPGRCRWRRPRRARWCSSRRSKA